MRAQLEETTAALSTANANVESLNGVLAQKDQALDALRTDNESRVDALNKLEAELKQLQSLEESHARLTHAHAQLTSDNETLTRQLAELEARNQQL